jgi:hypothetical protein
VHACRARPLARSTPVRCTRHSLGFSGRQTSSQSSRDGDDGSSSSARARARSRCSLRKVHSHAIGRTYAHAATGQQTFACMAHVKFMFVNVSSVRTCLIGHHAFHHQYVRDVLVLAILP